MNQNQEPRPIELLGYLFLCEEFNLTNPVFDDPGGPVESVSDEELLRAVMSSLGKKKSAAKTASGRQNAAKATRARQAAASPCTCGQNPHSWSCPVRRREYQQARRQAARAES